MSADQSRFRITAWPGHRYPLPPLRERLGLPPLCYVLEDGVLTPVFEQPVQASTLSSRDLVRAQRRAEIGETYLALAETSIDGDGAEEAIVAFAERYGVLGVRHHDFYAFSNFPRFNDEIKPRLEAEWSQHHPDVGFSLNEGIEDFRFGARVIRDLIRARRILNSEQIRPEWESLPTGATWLSDDEIVAHEEHETPITPEDEAAALLSKQLTAALRLFHPSVNDAPLDQHPVELALSATPIYARCCLELYNHIAGNAAYRQCANITCGRIFHRHTGRAEHRQHRSFGLIYCSTECANAQTQRNYRARQRASRSGAQGGADRPPTRSPRRRRRAR